MCTEHIYLYPSCRSEYKKLRHIKRCKSALQKLWLDCPKDIKPEYHAVEKMCDDCQDSIRNEELDRCQARVRAREEARKERQREERQTETAARIVMTDIWREVEREGRRKMAHGGLREGQRERER